MEDSTMKHYDTFFSCLRTDSLMALLTAVVMFTACSSADEMSDELTLPSPQPIPASANNTYKIAINAGKGTNTGDTRALALSGNAVDAIWGEGEQVYVYSNGWAHPYGAVSPTTTGTAATTLGGNISGAIAVNDHLELLFPRYTWDYNGQQGTLTDIAARYDYALSDVDVTSISDNTITTSNAVFTNQQAVVKFTLNTKESGSIASIGIVKRLSISAASGKLVMARTFDGAGVTSWKSTYGSLTVTLPDASATNEVYVALRNEQEGEDTYTLAAETTDGYIYTYTKDYITFANGKYYDVTLNNMRKESDYAPDGHPLTFQAAEAGVTVSFGLDPNSVGEGTLKYRLNESGDWATYTSGTEITLENEGDRVSFWSENITGYNHGGGENIVSVSGDCYVYGNILSLVNYNKVLTSDCTFESLFWGCNTIMNHPYKELVLPATTLTFRCYRCMFSTCTKLTKAPELPAMKMEEQCYMGMFGGCKGLTVAPELPATIMAESCYEYMFSNCTNLTTAPELPATTMAYRCYLGMFWRCYGLTKAPELPATTLAESCYNMIFMECSDMISGPERMPAMTLANDCYYAMFAQCGRLVNAPKLPATSLAYQCYVNMFEDCSSLITAPALPATTLAYMCYAGMFGACTSLTNAPALPAMTLAEGCYSNMFAVCTSLTTAPVLPATTLANSCYTEMFKYCTSLNYIKCLATENIETGISAWLDYASESGTFIKAKDVVWPRNINGIPSGWTVYEE